MSPEIKELQDRIEKLEQIVNYFVYADKYYFQRTLQLGNSTKNKIGMYGKSPIVQQAAITLTGGGATIDGNARTAIVAIIAALQAIGLTA